MEGAQWSDGRVERRITLGGLHPDNSGRRLHWRVGTAAHARELARALVAAADEIEQLDEVTR